MSEPTHKFFLLRQCARFYQEVAAIKQAKADERLAAYLQLKQDATPADYAAKVSAKLLQLLRLQSARLSNKEGVAKLRAQQTALYIMAALADEVFLLELHWPGQSEWLPLLLEQQLFHSCNGGSRFYKIMQQLIESDHQSELRAELAALGIIAIKLGFKGRYRGAQGHQALRQVRQKLYQIVTEHGDPELFHCLEPQQRCRQAYRYRLFSLENQRLAPLAPWRNFTWLALLSYFLVAAIIWLTLMHTFEQALNR